MRNGLNPAWVMLEWGWWIHHPCRSSTNPSCFVHGLSQKGIRAGSFANRVLDGSLARAGLMVGLACVAGLCLKELMSSRNVNQP